MILIAHRGNYTGPSVDENSPALIEEARLQGYHVEVDVWYMDGDFWLGHDKPVYKTCSAFLNRPDTWCHAKNLIALIAMKEQGFRRYFWHQEDDFTLTSCGYIWTYPGKPLTKYSILVMPENYISDINTIKELKDDVYGICSDFVSLLK